MKTRLLVVFRVFGDALLAVGDVLPEAEIVLPASENVLPEVGNVLLASEMLLPEWGSALPGMGRLLHASERLLLAMVIVLPASESMLLVGEIVLLAMVNALPGLGSGGLGVVRCGLRGVMRSGKWVSAVLRLAIMSLISVWSLLGWALVKGDVEENNPFMVLIGVEECDSLTQQMTKTK